MKYLLSFCFFTAAVIIIARSQSANLDSAMEQRHKARDAAKEKRRLDWGAKHFDASTNARAKVSVLLNPINAKHQIIEQHIVSYFDKGVLRYATNYIDRAKDHN